MKSVMFSINRPHTDNIKIGAKTSELRTRPPKIDEPYKAYIYETLKNGGCGKVIGEFIAYNENTYRICMGVPAHLVISGCISAEEIWRYTKNGEKDLTEISISDLVIYDKPKELSKFATVCEGLKPYQCDKCEYCYTESNESIGTYHECCCNGLKPLKRPPQSWYYVERCEE